MGQASGLTMTSPSAGSALQQTSPYSPTPSPSFAVLSSMQGTACYTIVPPKNPKIQESTEWAENNFERIETEVRNRSQDNKVDKCLEDLLVTMAVQ